MLKLSILSREVEEEQILGFCIVAETYEEALNIANISLRYYESPGVKQNISVHLHLEGSGACFFFDFGSDFGNVLIRNISEDIYHNFKRHFKRSPGYCIFLAYGHDEITPLSTSTFFMVKYDIYLDGSREFLENKKRFDWNSISRIINST